MCCQSLLSTWRVCFSACFIRTFCLIVQVLIAFLRLFFSPDSRVIYSYYLFIKIYNCVRARNLLYNYLNLKGKPCCSLVCELDSFWLNVMDTPQGKLMWIKDMVNNLPMKTTELFCEMRFEISTYMYEIVSHQPVYMWYMMHLLQHFLLIKD